MKYLAKRLLELWTSIPREIRMISLFLIVAIISFIMFFLPGIKAVEMLFTSFDEIGKVNLGIAIVSSMFILIILKKKNKN